VSFTTSLRFGDAGEAIWYQAHPGLSRIDGLKGDFLDANGEKWELKTDLWSMEKTPNFFIERYSDMARKTPGGPYQALVHGCRYFCYFYIASLTYFKFDCAELVATLDEVLPKLTPTEVQNKGYTTMGYRVPRDLLTHLAKPVTLKVSIHE
jgi:hypothetical protein